MGTLESIAPASGAQFSMLPPENATGNFTKVVQRLPVRIAVPSEVAREGILRPGLSVVVEVKTRDESEPRPSIVSALGLERVVARISDVLHRATGADQSAKRTSLGANEVGEIKATAAVHTARETETVQR